MVPDLIKWMRESYASLSVVTVNTVSGQFIGADERRVAIIISSHPTQRFTLLNDAQGAADQGINIPQNTRPFEMSIMQFGAAVKNGYFAICAGGPIQVGFIEVIQEEL